jgi:hypothetical protein
MPPAAKAPILPAAESEPGPGAGNVRTRGLGFKLPFSS